MAEYTPEWAEGVSGIPAADIRRIAIEFAKAAPACTTMCNRGSSAHINGYYNDRAIQLLNAIVGSVGIGILQNGKPVRGFQTPSRKFEIKSLFVQRIGRNEDCSELIARSGVTRTTNRPDNHQGHNVEVDPLPPGSNLPSCGNSVTTNW